MKRSWFVLLLCCAALLGAAPLAHAIVCPGTAPLPPAVGVCSVVPGGAPLLLQGHVLGPEEDLENGQVLVNIDGRISCAGCDCSADPDYAIATRVLCPQGVISPGLIDLTQALTYQQNPPASDTGERYEHRDDWRRGDNGHNQITTLGGASTSQRRYAELRALLAGVTTINGNASGTQTGFVRNFDTLDADAVSELRIANDRFPLGNGSDQISAGCSAYLELPAAFNPARITMLTIAEGISPSAANEWNCVNGQQSGSVDVIADLPIAGLLALDAQDGELLRTRGSTMVWHPRHAIRLYGHPGPVASFHRMGVPIALGTLWQPTGSTQLLREMHCAADLSEQYLGQPFDPREIWRMATRNAARALRADDTLGVIAPGRLADLVVFDARVRSAHEAVVRADPIDVVLLLRGGLALYGESGPMNILGRPDPDCEAINVCGDSRRVCVQEEIGESLATLITGASPSPGVDAYDLVVCPAPPDEPTCIPSRSASVLGSTVYDGIPAAGDADGDGIADPDDNCPTVFNPVRPVDLGEQSDVDGDDIGDECDACPVEAGNLPCSVTLFEDGFEAG